MTDWRFELEERALLFASERSRRIIGQLGYGYDGTVFATDRQSALKVLRFARLYERERDIYKRLQQCGVYSVLGFAVPQLIDYSDNVMVIEIGIVSPPSCSTSPARTWISARIIRMMFSKNGWKTSGCSSAMNAGTSFSPSWRPSVGSGYISLM